MEFPRTLVISSSFFSKNSNNGKTLSSFFYGYPIDKLFQISFSVSNNNPSVCKKYFAITITDVLKRRKGKEYSVINEKKNKEESNKKLLKRIFHFFSEKRLPVTTLVKNIIWLFCDRTGIYEYIETIKPDVVFFQGFSMSYGYKIALEICEKYDLPMVLELTDDYTERLFWWSLIDRYNHKIYERYFRKAINYSNSIIVISPKMKREYEKKYGKTMIEMMNSVAVDTIPESMRDKHLFVYAGNVRLNRWKVLLEFGKAIYSMNTNNILYICTPDKVSNAILRKFRSCPSIQYGGSLDSTELHGLFLKCEYVVHVEAFDNMNRKITRLSLSTKIPEYLASGALLIAIGPKDIASMDYVLEKKVGICVNSNRYDDIYKILNSSLNNKELVRLIKLRGQDLCKKNHSIRNNTQLINKLLQDATTFCNK